MLCGESPALPSLGPQGGLLLFATLLAMLTLSIGPGGIQRLYNVPRQSVALIVGFLLLPYCYAFGTVNNYWNYIAQASIFGVGASVTLLAAQPSYRRKSAALCSLALVTLLLSTQLMLDGMQRPYRQSVALAAQTRAIVVGPHHAVLQVSEDFAQYILDARNLARSAGFKPNEPMLDLSGQSPGLLFALSARSIGQPWSIGGYTGSAALTTHMLARVSCDDLARTWLLVEPNSKRRLPDTVVASFGADLAKDFSVLGSVDTPPKTNGMDMMESMSSIAF